MTTETRTIIAQGEIHYGYNSDGQYHRSFVLVSVGDDGLLWIKSEDHPTFMQGMLLTGQQILNLDVPYTYLGEVRPATLVITGISDEHPGADDKSLLTAIQNLVAPLTVEVAGTIF
jgi:hypothetical protein